MCRVTADLNSWLMVDIKTEINSNIEALYGDSVLLTYAASLQLLVLFYTI